MWVSWSGITVCAVKVYSRLAMLSEVRTVLKVLRKEVGRFSGIR